MVTRSLPLIGLALLTAACNGGARDAVQLEWDGGDTWQVAASYRVAIERTEEVPTDLEGGDVKVFGENWTDEVVWTYQVVESDFTPEASDELYAYAATATGGVAALDVVRAYVDPSLNDDPELLEADPVVYLVFHSERDRLAAVVSFTNVDDERVEAAWSTKELGRSWSALSQSMLTAAPTYLAPFSTAYEDDSRVLEDGSLLDTERVDEDTVDAFYDDELGGDLVASRYERGQPWPTWTASDNVEARLMSADEVSRRRSQMPPVYPPPPEDYDYRAALASSIDIEAALTLDTDTMGGGWYAEAPEGYRPWAGSWWPQSEGALVFGYDGRDTYSDRLKETIDPIKTKMDNLSSEIRDMEDGSAKDAKITEYREEQSKLVDELVGFYRDGILADLDGGRLTVSNGQLSHTDGWSYDLDELSPMDKLALHIYLEGETSPNPFYLPAWELLNHYSPAGGSWWGHCNGWSAAAILNHEPTETVSATMGGHAVDYTSADLKGLLSEANYSSYSRFYGERYNGPDQDITDLSPAAFHKLVSFYIREQQVPMVFDTTATEQVWNFPAWSAELLVVETTEGGMGDLVNVNTADLETLDTLPGIGETLATRIIEHRELNGPFQAVEELDDVRGIGPSTLGKLEDLVTVTPVERTFEVVADVRFATDGVGETHVDSGSEPQGFTETWGYTLVTDSEGLVLSGAWDEDESHPDFAWIPYSNPTARSSGGSENPYLPYGLLLDYVGEDLQRQ